MNNVLPLPDGEDCPATHDDTVEWLRLDGQPGAYYGDESPGPEWEDHRFVCVRRDLTETDRQMMMYPPEKTFWRMDNPWLWAIGLGGLAFVGGGVWYMTRKR